MGVSRGSRPDVSGVANMVLTLHATVKVLWFYNKKRRWYDGVVVKVGRTRYTVAYDDGAASSHTVSQWGRDKRVKVARPCRKRGSDAVAKHAAHTYDSVGKKDSPHKRRCRDFLGSLLTGESKRKALVLDDQHLMGTKMLHDTSIEWDVVTPNNDEHIVAAMRKADISRPVHGFIGEVIVDRTNEDVYDFVWLDYCGTPGDAGKAASPMWDVAQLFALGKLAPGATLAVPVCARSRTKSKEHDPKYVNLCRITQQVYHSAALAGRLVAQDMTMCPYVYKDVGAQTMCFTSFTVA